MKAVAGFLIIVFIVVCFSSCQKEIDWGLSTANGNDSLVQSMMRIVETDVSSGDSITRNFKTVIIGGQKTIIMSEVDSFFPINTVYSKFSYDAQNHLTSITVTESILPATVLVKYSLTWNSGRLQKVSCDTLGSFSESYDFIYSTVGSNTLINSIRTPPIHPNNATFTYDVKVSLVVNGSFLPVSWTQSDRLILNQGGPLEYYNDTKTAVFNFPGGNLLNSTYFTIEHDTTSCPLISYYTDTTSFDYTRNTLGTNLSDSLKKVMSPELFTLGNFQLFYFDNLTEILGLLTFDKFAFTASYNDLRNSKRYWINGVFDPSGSYSNVLFRKIDNSFDAMGRLTGINVYQDFSTTNLATKSRIYY